MPGAYRIKRFGWLPDPFDHRDLTLQSTKVQQALKGTQSRSKGRIKAAVPKKLPASVDLRNVCSSIEDQEMLGSCTAQAAVGVLEFVWKQTYGRHVDASRLFVYKATRNLLGWTGDTGAFVRTAIKAVRLFGACPEDYWPYDISQFDVEPPAFCYSFAQNFKALVYYRLQETVLELKRSLAQGVPFAFGFACFESLEGEEVRRTGIIPFPQLNESQIGGHAVVAVGYNDQKKWFVIRNSWGRGWGKDGYGYLPYQYFDANLADDCWCILKSSYEDVDGG